MNKIKKLLKNLLSLALTLLVMSILMDFIRKPDVPTQANTTVLVDLQNQPFFLAQLSQEQPAVIYFWGSWCGYCKHTSPAVNSLAQDGVPVVTVALRSGSDDQVKQYLSENNYQFRTVNDPNGEISHQWDVSVTPTIIIFDKGKMDFATTGLTSYWGLKVRLFLAELF